MNIDLTDEMILAIGVAFDELGNSSVWTEFISEKQSDMIEVGRNELNELTR